MYVKLSFLLQERRFIKTPLLSVPGRQMKRNKLQFNSIQAIALKLAK